MTTRLNEGAQRERRAFRDYLRKHPCATAKLMLLWIAKRSARTAKRKGGLGRR